MTRRSYTPWTPAQEAALRAAVRQGKLMPDLVTLLRRSHASIRNKIAALGLSYRTDYPDDGAVEATPSEPTVPGVPAGESTIASPLQARPVSLDELLTTFGLVRDDWDVVECTPNIWQVGAKHPVSGEIITAPLYQLKARLRAKAGVSSEILRAQLLSDIRAETVLRPRVTHRSPAVSASDLHALALDIFDLHLGKLGWAEEVHPTEGA